MLLISFFNFYSITKPTFENFNEEISLIFSTPEKPINKNLYYYPYCKESEAKSTNAGGLMYDKYLSVRKKLIQYGVIKPFQQLREGKLLM